MAARWKAGRYRLTEEEASASVKAEQQRRRALRWEEVRAQSRSHAAEIRQRVQLKKQAEVRRLEQKIEQELQAAKDMELQELGFQYQAQLMDVGKAFVNAEAKGDFVEGKERNKALLRATTGARGAEALEAVREEQKNKADNVFRRAASLKASREAKNVRAVEVARKDPPQPNAVDLLFTPHTRSPSKQKPHPVHTESSTMTPSKANPMVKALAEMSTIQKEIFGDVDSLGLPDAPQSPAKSSSLEKKTAVSALPSPKGWEQQARLRSSDSARREERRKKALKLFEDLERMDKQMLAKYPECKENVEVNIQVDKMDEHLKALLLRGGSPQPWSSQQSADKTLKQVKPRTAIPLSSPKRPLFRQAVQRSSRKRAQELALMALPLPAQATSRPMSSVTSEGEATADHGNHQEPVPSEVSPSFDSASFLNVTTRRRPFHPRMQDEDSCSSVKMPWNRKGSPCSPEASPRVASSSAGSSTTSYLGLPEGYGRACLETHLLQWQQESTMFHQQLSSEPHTSCSPASQEKACEPDLGMCQDAAVEGDSPLPSPGSLDTAFIEESSPCSEHTPQMPLSWRSEPDASTPLGAPNGTLNTPGSNEDGNENLCFDTSDGSEGSPCGSVFDEMPRQRPPSTVRMLANQEVLIPHQLSTIAEMETSVSSTATSSSKGSTSSRGSSTECYDQGPILEAQKGAQKIFMDLEDKVEALEAELRFICHTSPTPTSSCQLHAESLQEPSLLINMAEPTLVPADAATILLSPFHESSMSESLISFIRHEESFARAELRNPDQPLTL